MNYEILQNHVDGVNYDINPSLNDDNSNVSAFYCADVVGNKSFVQNYGGYPRSEIAEINDAANVQQQAALLQMLTDYTPSDNPNAGLSDAEIMLSHRSKYQQTASEQISWLENQLEIRDQKRIAEQMKSESGNKIEFTETLTHSDND